MSDQTPTEKAEAAQTARERSEQGREHVNQAASSAAGTMHKATDRVEQSVHRGAEKMSEAAGRAAEQGREKWDSAKEYADDWMDTAGGYVREHPAQSLAIAVAAGWLIGRIMHHRH